MKLLNGEVLLRQWSYSNYSTLTLTNKRLIDETNMNDMLVYKKDFCFTDCSRLESYFIEKRIPIILRVFSCLLALAAIIGGIVSFTKIGNWGLFLGLEIVGLLLLWAAFRRNKAGLTIKGYVKTDIDHPAEESAMIAGVSYKSKAPKLRRVVVTRAQASEIIAAIGAAVVVKEGDNEYGTDIRKQ